jgi:nitrate reductase gamma subunit
MATYLNTLVFGIYPYIALVVLAVGTIVRYDREPYTWRSGSSQLLRRKQLIWGSVLFHVGILVIFFGHLVGLLTPIELFDLLGIGHGFKQVLAIVMGGVAGVIALVGATLLLHRRLFDARVRATSSFGDIAILVLIYIQLVLGIATIFVSIQHLDGGEMVKFIYVAEVHWLFKLHLFLGLTIFLVFPFTRLVHMLSAPLRYIWRPGYQVVRTRRKSFARGASKSVQAPAE